MATHSIFWPGESHGVYSPWGCKESDMTERLSQTQKENMGSLELENSMDRGAWQATVYGITKSCTRLTTFTHKASGSAAGRRDGSFSG